MIKRIFFPIFLAIILTACGGSQSDQEKLDALKKQKADIEKQIADLELKVKKTDTSSAKVTVDTMTVKLQAFKHYIEVQGKVESDENILLTAKTPGIITSILVKRGDRVTKGQLLATLDGNIVLQGVEEVKNQLSLAKTVYEKQKRLWDQGIGTEVALLSAKTNKDALEKRLNSMYEQYALYNIKSPINGTIDDVMPKVGESAMPGFPMIRVVNLAKTKVTAEVSEAYASKIKKGDDVILFYPDLNKEVPAKVTERSTVINAASRSFTIEVAINTTDAELHPNMIAVVKVNDYINKSARVVPMNLVQRDESGTFLYVAVADGKRFVAKRKIITTGISYNGLIEVKDGLTDSDLVISTGYQNISEGEDIGVGLQK